MTKGEEKGLTKREYFAAKALAPLVNQAIMENHWDVSAIAHDAISIADAILAALKGE
jgi:hypothetical protein